MIGYPPIAGIPPAFLPVRLGGFAGLALGQRTWQPRNNLAFAADQAPDADTDVSHYPCKRWRYRVYLKNGQWLDGASVTQTNGSIRIGLAGDSRGWGGGEGTTPYGEAVVPKDQIVKIVWVCDEVYEPPRKSIQEPPPPGDDSPPRTWTCELTWDKNHWIWWIICRRDDGHSVRARQLQNTGTEEDYKRKKDWEPKVDEALQKASTQTQVSEFGPWQPN